MTRIRVRFQLLLTICACIALLSPGSDRACAQLLAGGARIDITPDTAAFSVPLGGYAARASKPATGIHDRVYARALAISSGKERVALVSLDLCFLPAGARAEIIRYVAASGVTGIDPTKIIIACTHSHTSPDPLAMLPTNTMVMKGWTSYSERLTTFETAKIAEAIVLAYKRMIPAKIASGTLDCTGSNRNRRGDKVTDTTMTLLRVTDEQGRSIGAIVNFAAHPTLYDDKMMEISADWPGAMCGYLEKSMGGDAVALFLNGAEGDASPNGATGPSPSDKVQNYGVGLGEKAWDVLRLMQLHDNVKVRGWRTPVELPAKKPNALFIIAARSFGATTAQAIDLVNKMMPKTTSIGFIEIGDALYIGMPCEPTGELGLLIKEAARKAGYQTPAIVALSDDWIAYALTPEQYQEGNYEAGMSFYGVQLGPCLLKSATTGLQMAKE